MPNSSAVRHARVVAPDPTAIVIARFALAGGGVYRLSHAVGGHGTRRVSRSIGLFQGTSRRRMWDGETALCLEFTLPQGRTLSLLAAQLIDARPTSRNHRGRWVLVPEQAMERPGAVPARA